MENIPRLVA